MGFRRRTSPSRSPNPTAESNAVSSTKTVERVPQARSQAPSRSGSPNSMAQTGMATAPSDCRKKNAARRASKKFNKAIACQPLRSSRASTVGRPFFYFAGNSALKDLRRDPYILLPGDQVSIPSKVQRMAEVSGGKAEYVLQATREILRVRFTEADFGGDRQAPFVAQPY